MVWLYGGSTKPVSYFFIDDFKEVSTEDDYCFHRGNVFCEGVLGPQ